MELTTAQKKDLLAEHFLLRHVPAKDLERLAETSKTKRYSAEEPIFQKGEIADSMMVVVEGAVRISAQASSGDDVTFATIMAGEVFGEIALIDGYERSADAVSVGETELLIVSNYDFIPILKNNSDLCINFLKILCDRIRQTNVLLEDFSYLDLRRRIAKRLIYMSGSNSAGVQQEDISVRVSLAQLIVMMGVSRSAVEAELKDWVRIGLIEMKEDWIAVTDVDKLSSFVQD